jgi:hypothetical protein
MAACEKVPMLEMMSGKRGGVGEVVPVSGQERQVALACLEGPEGESGRRCVVLAAGM